jgi:hypothetical protein
VVHELVLALEARNLRRRLALGRSGDLWPARKFVSVPKAA